MSLSELDDIICHESSMSPEVSPPLHGSPQDGELRPQSSPCMPPEVSYITRLKNKISAQRVRFWTQPFFVTTLCEFAIQYTSHFGTKASQKLGHGSGILSPKPIQYLEAPSRHPIRKATASICEVTKAHSLLSHRVC